MQETNKYKECKSPLQTLNNTENTNKKPLWITNGKVFRVVQKNQIHRESNQKKCGNWCSMLEEENIEEYSNDNIIAHFTSKNVTLRKTNETLNKQVGKWIATCKIKKMKVEVIETYLKSIEKDYKEVLRESDDQMQTLKKELH